MNRKIVALGALFGIVAIALGAFGAHGLKQYLTETQLQTFETGVRYQMYHAILLVAVGLSGQLHGRAAKWFSGLITSGVCLFSGSIYLLSTSAFPDFNKIIGPVTPIGGLCLIVGWTVLFVAFLKRKS